MEEYEELLKGIGFDLIVMDQLENNTLLVCFLGDQYTIRKTKTGIILSIISKANNTFSKMVVRMEDALNYKPFIYYEISNLKTGKCIPTVEWDKENYLRRISDLFKDHPRENTIYNNINILDSVVTFIYENGKQLKRVKRRY